MAFRYVASFLKGASLVASWRLPLMVSLRLQRSCFVVLLYSILPRKSRLRRRIRYRQRRVARPLHLPQPAVTLRFPK